jgi:hypothetical protein
MNLNLKSIYQDMIFKKGDVYRNKESNTPCYIKENHYDDRYLLYWTYRHEETGYREYEGWYTHEELLTEMSKGYMDVVSYGDKDSLILQWIPQHNIVTI